MPSMKFLVADTPIKNIYEMIFRCTYTMYTLYFGFGLLLKKTLDFVSWENYFYRFFLLRKCFVFLVNVSPKVKRHPSYSYMSSLRIYTHWPEKASTAHTLHTRKGKWTQLGCHSLTHSAKGVTMVLISDGCSLKGAHVRRNISYSTCSRH